MYKSIRKNFIKFLRRNFSTIFKFLKFFVNRAPSASRTPLLGAFGPKKWDHHLASLTEINLGDDTQKSPNFGLVQWCLRWMFTYTCRYLSIYLYVYAYMNVKMFELCIYIIYVNRYIHMSEYSYIYVCTTHIWMEPFSFNPTPLLTTHWPLYIL